MSSASGRVGAASGIAADPVDMRPSAARRDDTIRPRHAATPPAPAPAAPAPTVESPSPSPRPAAADGRSSVGTVQNLRPLPALTVPQTISVADASQLCAAKRTDCVLVVDQDEHLAGIFTAKDLAFRVVASGWDPRLTPVSAIMTRSPVVTRDTTSATEALNLMVTRGFRHLPVCNDQGDVVGLLDIARVFYGALTKLERAHASSQKLYAALEGVQTEWGAPTTQQLQLLDYIEKLRERLALPDLAGVLDARTIPTTVSVRTTVREAARLMKQHRVTAVCVMDNTSMAASYQTHGVTSGKVAGIFTSKDVVLRVIAAGLDPRTCSVVRVMTPHPDTAAPSLSIQAALRKMHDGRYLNLPVVDEQSRLVGVVDVLRLTWKTLEQINSMNEDSTEGMGDGASVSSKGEAGPMWNRFWNSFAHTGSYVGEDEPGDESLSVSASGISNSLPHRSGRHSSSRAEPSRIPRPTSRASAGSGTRPTGRASPSNGLSASAAAQSLPPDTPGNETTTDLYPGDSASAVGARRRNSVSRSGPALDPVAAIATSAPSGQAAETFLFKFSTPSRRTHRFAAPVDNLAALRSVIVAKLEGDEFCRASATPGLSNDTKDAVPQPDDFTIAYEDDEKDMVMITSDDDVKEAVRSAREGGTGRVLLYLQGGPSWETPVAQKRIRSRRDAKDGLTSVAEEEEASSSHPPSRRSVTSSLAGQGQRKDSGRRRRAASSDDESLDSSDSESESDVPSRRRRDHRHSRRDEADDLLLGILPKDLALPAAIGFLGVALLAAVVVTRPRH